MIYNLPKKESFKSIARDCLSQAVNNMFDIIRDFNEGKELAYGELSESQIWEYHQGDLRTCLILIYQGIELYLKGEVCNESPYLLLETPRKNWPTIPESSNKDFNEFFTISGEHLL